jgi:TPR repeat protein
VLLATQGCEAAMLNVAWMLCKRRGWQQQQGSTAGPQLALNWLHRAAAMGAPEAAVDAAHVYLRGDQLGLPGGTQRERAVRLYRQVRATQTTHAEPTPSAHLSVFWRVRQFGVSRCSHVLTAAAESVHHCANAGTPARRAGRHVRAGVGAADRHGG